MHFVTSSEPSANNAPGNAPSSLTALPTPLVGQALVKHAIANATAIHVKPVAADSSSAASGDNNKDKKIKGEKPLNYSN